MEFLILGVLILLNGFFALSEIALVSAKRSALEQSKKEGSYGAGIALKLLENSEGFLSAVQVGITLIGIITGMYGGIAMADNIAPFFDQFDATRAYSHELSLGLTVVTITYVSIVIGELVPKTVALSNSNKVARIVAPFIFYFSKAFYPFVLLLSASTNFINGILGIRKHPDTLTESELRQLIKSASREGVIDKGQDNIHERIFYFAEKKAKHLMTHRTDIEWIDLDEDENSIKEQLLRSKHSKIICCRGELDNFVGFIMTRDYYKALYNKQKIKLQSLMKEPVVVPENTDANKVLNILKEEAYHLCFVVNEYGGFEGIITMHDILENFLGPIPDEWESHEPDVFVRDDKSILISGDAPIETLAELLEDFELDFEKIDYSTVAGFVFSLINKIPQVGDKIEYGEYLIEIVDVDINRIDKILVTRKPQV